ncbi:MAG: BamA/TamA family outer membrane protein, partial [Crocinitomicaceae bacterium]|nr:BamA/TamA family outer membrane protein [Crocinitomicaceae bacterium]
MQHFGRSILSVFISVVILSSCSISRKIPEGEVYFKNHRLVIHDAPEEYAISKDELFSLTRIKPNRRILWVRFNLRIYCWLVPEKKLKKSIENTEERCAKKNQHRLLKEKKPKTCKSLWSWLAYTVGEPPVLLDTVKVKRSAEQMNVLLEKNGFFNGKVTSEILYSDSSTWFWKNRRKSETVYHVYPGTPYHIRNVVYDIEDPGMVRRTDDLKKAALIAPGMIFQVNLLDRERDRITDYFNNHGYYEFTKDFIVYDADSTVGNREVDIILKLKTQKIPSPVHPDSLLSVPHKKYFIENVFVNTNYNPLTPDLEPLSQITNDEGIIIQSSGKPEIKPTLITYITYIKQKEGYQKKNIDLTYKRYAQLGVARSVNIQLVPKKQIDSTGLYGLDAHILMNPARKQSLSFDPRVTNRSGNMGIYGNFVYGHKNLFHGAESLRLSIVTGFEASQTLGQGSTSSVAEQQIERSFRLNTFEIGPELNISIPRLWPFGYSWSSQNSDPKAVFSGAVNYQRRPDYERTLTQIGYGWDWIENPNKVTRINIRLVEVSLIKIEKSPDFEAFIQRLNDGFLANSYRDHLIAASRIGFTLNTQKKKLQRSYIYYKSTILESAGNLLYAYYKNSGNKPDKVGSYEINGIRFAHYLKTDHDLRYYFNSNDKNSFVARAYSGLGVPLKNLNVLPFEKSFFSGGANGLRAWQARTLGPGSYRDTTAVRTFNNIGDIKLEFNVEYRFKLTQMLNAAFFVDAGNIWLLNSDEVRSGAQFKFSRFASEIAVGAGAGLRLDFDFFLVRLDMGVPLKDPQKIQGERWIWQPKTEYLQYLNRISNTGQSTYKNRPVLNLGIG